MSQSIQAINLIASLVNRTWDSIEGADVLSGIKLTLRKENAARIIEGLADAVNQTASMTEDQAVLISGYIVDHLSARKDYPSAQEFMQMATYINSCRLG